MKIRMFYLRCCFNLPFCFWFVCFFCLLLIQGFKVQSSCSVCGDPPACTPFSNVIKMTKVFLLDRKTMCAKLYVFFLLLMLWILTVHKKKLQKNTPPSVFRCISINLGDTRNQNMQKGCCHVTDFYLETLEAAARGFLFAAVCKIASDNLSFFFPQIGRSFAQA